MARKKKQQFSWTSDATSDLLINGLMVGSIVLVTAAVGFLIFS